jgi:hypothetical protein
MLDMCRGKGLCLLYGVGGRVIWNLFYLHLVVETNFFLDVSVISLFSQECICYILSLLSWGYLHIQFSTSLAN